jgi:UDP-glucose 4-epimerase
VPSPPATNSAAQPSSSATSAARAASRLPEEVLNQLRYGRGQDNRKLKGAGYNFGYTSREAVLKHAEAMRVRSLRSREGEPYRYEREVEEFLRWSPSVRRKGTV